MKSPKNPRWEAFKELARLVLFALPGLLVAFLTTLPTSQSVLTSVAILRYIDSYIHNNPNDERNGLTNF